MPMQLAEVDSGKVARIHVKGKLSRADYEKFVPEFERRQEHGKLRVLFDLGSFHGWEINALWDEIQIDRQHVADIERIAVVGHTKWQHSMHLLLKPFSQAAIRHFGHSDAAEARRWLAEA